MKIYLMPYIFLKRYNDEMLVVNTLHHTLCLVNDIAANILEFLYREKEVLLSEVIQSCEINDTESVNNFIEELRQQGIVNTDQNKSPFEVARGSSAEYEENIEADFQMKFARDQKLYAALIELTYRCNLRCQHCYAIDNSNNKEMSKNEYFQLLDQLYVAGVFRLTFTGGEIFVREDALEIIEYAYKKGFLIDIFSNATLLDDEKIVTLSKCYIRSFQVSIYSHRAEIHDRITGIAGSLEKSIRMIERLRKNNISVNIKSVLMEENYQDYKGIEQLSKKLGTTFQTSMYLIPHNDGSTANLVHRICKDENKLQILKEDMQRDGVNSYYRARNLKEPMCNIGKTGVSIDPYGNVFPCNLLKVKLGNILKDNISDIWENSSELNSLRELTISDVKGCAKCDKKEFCFFCPGAALAETGSLIKPYEEACKFAEIKKNLSETRR